MSKRKGSCNYKLNGKCTLTQKWCKLLKENFWVCDNFVEFEGGEDE